MWIPYWRVVRRCSLIGAYPLLSAHFAAALNILAYKNGHFIRRISRISACFLAVEI